MNLAILLWPFARKRALNAIDKGDTDAFVRLYTFFAAESHLEKDSEFDTEELKNHEKHLARRARIAFLCPSAFPTDSESEKIREVAACIFNVGISPNIEYLDSFLSLLERRKISVDARLMMVECLKKFLPGHADIFQLDSLKKRIVSAMVGESEAIFRTLDELLCAVNRRWTEAQAQTEPE